ncbi:MAG: M15 family metallopeptidase [Treponema sp.]|jgi:hypothetical protein|nr:M15 family metallopeptidase [Treponema sp.]
MSKKNAAGVFFPALVLLFLVFHPVFSETKPDGEEFGRIVDDYRAVFDYHFSRADRELNPERWLETARRGVDLAIGAWETMAAELTGDAAFRSEMREHLRDWGKEELEERFSRWLLGRFFGGALSRSAEGTAAAVRESNLLYTYHLDEEGNILYDEATGDPLVIRPGEGDFLQDRRDWLLIPEASFEHESAVYEDTLARLFPELLAFIPGEDRASFEEKLSRLGVLAPLDLRKEFENVVAREERLFTARRTGDVWSLRRKSDDEAASAVAARIIGEAEEICREGIASLSTRIEEASAGAGDLALAGNEWLEEYREQFNRGLKAWEDAEERFFISRIEWEQEAGILYTEGESAWTAAYNQFEAERQKWERNAAALFASGETLFLKASENLEKSIKQAKAEFEKDAALRTEAGAERARAWVDMYITSGGMVASARENISFWENWTGQENVKKQELETWRGIYNAYIGKALEAREALIRDFGIVMGKGSLADVLAEGVSSEDFNLDEYQVELIRARAVASYWEKRFDIAMAVSAYAEELTAGRITDAEGVKAWENAKDAYDRSLAYYEDAVEKLGAAGTETAGAMEVLDNAARLLKESDARLEGMNREYSVLSAVLATGKASYIQQELTSRYMSLLDEYGLLDVSGEHAAYLRYLEYGFKLGVSREKESAGELLKALVTGDGGKSLAVLESEAKGIAIINAGSGIPQIIDGYGIPRDNPYYKAIEELLALRSGEIAASPGSEDEINGRFGEIISRMVVLAKSAAETDLVIRIRSLDLFTAASGAAWYFSGRLPSADERKAFEAADMAAVLREDAGRAFTALLEARLSLELEGLACVLERGTGSGEGETLARFFSGDGEDAQKLYEILSALMERVREDPGALYTGDETEDGILDMFIFGGGFLPSSAYLEAEENAWRLSSGLLEAFLRYGSSAAFAGADAWHRFTLSLGESFEKFGIETAGGMLPGAKTAAEAVMNREGDPGVLAAEFFEAFDDLSFLPQWLRDEAEAWKLSLVEYMAALAVYSGRIHEDELELPGRRLEEIEARLMELAVSPEISQASGQRERALYDELYAARGPLYIQSLFAEAAGRCIAFLSAGQKSWREYISEEYLGHIEDLIPGAPGRMETLLMDLSVQAERDTEKLEAAFSIHSGGIAGYYDDTLAAAAALYAEDPGRSWDESVVWKTPYLLADDYNAALSEYRWHLQYEKALRRDLESLGAGYDYFGLDIQETRDAMNVLESKMAAEKNVFENLSALYSDAALRFLQTGAAYDALYSLAKDAYTDMEEKRFLYDREDAVRRWASTAYLGIDHDEIEISRTSLERARIVLAVLSELYNEGEERRPYEDETYEKLYDEYRKSFERMLLSLRAQDAVNGALLKEAEKLDVRYAQYTEWLRIMQGNLNYAETYLSPADRSAWKLKDLVTVREDGRLAFSFNGIDAQQAAVLSSYFTADNFLSGENNAASSFEEAIRGLNTRMVFYFSDPNRYQLWALARDFLVRTLYAASGIPYLGAQYDSADAMAPGTPLGNIYVAEKGDEIWRHAYSAELNVNAMQITAWNSLSAEERADLEFYTILTLSGGGGNERSSFSKVSAMTKYFIVFNHVNYQYNHYRENAGKFGIGFLFNARRDRAAYAFIRVIVPTLEYQSRVLAGSYDLKFTVTQLNNSLGGYLDSCKRIQTLNGENSGGVDWEGIYASLNAADVFTAGEIDRLHEFWNDMISRIGGTYVTVPEALERLARWSRGEKEDIKSDLEAAWREDEEERLLHEAEFRRAAENFITEGGDTASLANAAAAAFGASAPARKNHLGNLEGVLMNDLGGITENGSGYRNEYSSLAEEYSALITRSYASRQYAELAAREAEWNEQRRDIAEKYSAWKKSASLILERGRSDWKAGVEKMQEAFSRWVENYAGEYARINDSWNAAYLAGLRDKETWLNQAALAAERASTGAALALVGDDAEMMVRTMDTRIPAGFSAGVAETDAGGVLGGLLDASGIRNMADALSSLNGASGTLAVYARTGLGGLGVWDSGAAGAAASRLARESNAELAVRESRRLAASARQAADDAIRLLGENVEEANRSFRKNTDEMFVLGSQWMKLGNKYVKDIIVNSTLFQSVITDRIEIAGYMDYIFGSPEIQTNLSESYLANLGAFAIQGLIQNAYDEIEAHAAEIFGYGEDRKLISPKMQFLSLEERYQEPGKFGAHIGYIPLVNKNSGGNPDVMFFDTGSGELGRLMVAYQYWEVKDLQGVSMMNLAIWDKPLWDSRGSFFSAPTIRDTFEIASQAGAALVATAMAVASPFTGFSSLAAGVAVMAAAITTVSVADDFVFAALDTAYGYKSFGEAAFEFGKKALVTGASSVIGGVFGGVPGLSQGLAGAAASRTSGTLAGLAGRTIMSGYQAAASGLVTSALGGIQYSREGGWSYSTEAFRQGLGGMSGVLSAMAGTAVAGGVGLLNSGVDIKTGMSSLEGFSSLNQWHVGKLNGLLGGLASESVNYAFSGDFALNLANANLLLGGNYDAGLLEMHVGDGFGMNFGTTGADISPQQLYASAQGALVWGVNIGIDIFSDKNNFDAKAALRAQYGYGGQKSKKQLWNLVTGKDTLLTGSGGFGAETEIIDGRRTVTLNGYREGMSAAEQMALAVVLGHEAGRDGIVTSDNYLETRGAVYEHTQMALRMLQDGQNIAFNQNLVDDLYAYVSSNGNMNEFNAYVDNNYDSSGDYWLLKTDGTLVDDESADLHWEAVNKGTKEDPVYKTIMSFKGMSKEESLVALLGGNENALQMLQQNEIFFDGNINGQILGSLIIDNFTDVTSGVLNIPYSQLHLNKDWQGIYESYIANETFFKGNTWFSGRKDLLIAANLGDKLTEYLEYYSLLFEPLKTELPLEGTSYENDPLGYLKANTSVFTYPGETPVRIHNDMIDDLHAAYKTIKSHVTGALSPGAIPSNAAGLSIRFINNDTVDSLYLSDHATGHAIDYDPKNNGQYFIENYARTNKDFNDYLFNKLGILQENAKGWADNQKLLQLYRNYQYYVRDNPLLSNTVTDDDLYKIPELNFLFSKTFTETMRKYFDWGGDWWPQKDYMHFQKK